ncbi:MAG TPA: H-X9-DG-CTERM domain-containing protein [Thermoanaerobaculia bacterium]|nr:H-X9-DG-CTERM domain-containing protein [Thermoanaerobaculia bacterium]
MSAGELQRLFDAAAEDAALREDLVRVGSDRELSDLASRRGYRVTVEDVASLRSELDAGQLEQVAGGFSSQHSGGVNVCMGDGSVRWVVSLLPYLEQGNL